MNSQVLTNQKINIYSGATKGYGGMMAIDSGILNYDGTYGNNGSNIIYSCGALNITYVSNDNECL